MIKVMICDDLKEIRDHFSDMINSQDDISVICSAENENDAVSLALSHKPDVVLMDIQMDNSDSGINATRRICEALPDTKIIILTIHNSDDLIVDAYLAGAVDYLLKSSDIDTICNSIRKTYETDEFLGSFIANTLKQKINNSKKQEISMLYLINHISTLTATEMIILKYLCNKTKRREIAKLEFISENTVKVHINHILRKLNFSSVFKMVNFLEQIGITSYINSQNPSQGH